MSSWKNSFPLTSPHHTTGSNGNGGAGGGTSYNSNNGATQPYHQQSSTSGVAYQLHQHQQQQQQQFQPHNMTAAAAAAPNTMSDGPRTKCDAIVFEAIAKAAEIVVGSRCWIDYNTTTTTTTGGGQNSSSNTSNVHLPQNQYQQYQAGTTRSGNGGGGNTTTTNGYGNSNNPSSSSSRFNLLVPEVQGVRSILQRWKRALHVPLRLDVYYQHPDSQRELLERWCLEYAPGGGPSLDFLSTDPIVQLRHVCKNIVIWLRTLYCWSHMLPAQALRKLTTNNAGGDVNPIGFSIYVVSEGQDDVSGLVSSQGFHSQGQPRSVHTPYGELGWKVFYAPKELVQRLLPEVPAYATHHGTAYASLQNHQQQQQQQHHHQQQQQQQHDERNGGHASRATTRPIPMTNQHQQHPHHQDNGQQGVVHSAPQHTGFGRLYRRSNSDVNETAATQAAKSYHHRREMMTRAGRAKSGDIIYDEVEDDSCTGIDNSGGGNSNGRPFTVRRMQQMKRNGNGNSDHDGDSDMPPTKNLSALSLALMMSDEQMNSIEGSSFNSNGTGDGDDANVDHPPSSAGRITDRNPESEADMVAAEKRRAALHSPAPFSSGVAAAAGEYGYAYNSQIPMFHHPMTPNASNTASSQPHQHPYGTSLSSSYSSTHNQNRHRLGSSPSMRPSTPLSSTPPGYLLSGTPITGGMIGGMAHGGSATGTLIPPRSAVTPPFVRPVGFMVDPPQQPLPPAVSAQDHSAYPHPVTDKGQPHSDLDTTLQQHQTSLDLLHSSPFQFPPGSYSFHNSSLHQQLSSGGEGAVLAPAAFMNEFYHRAAVPPEEHSFASGFPPTGGLMTSGQDLEYDDGHEMPFAVDGSSMTCHTAVAGSARSTATHGLASMMNEASLVASMCTAAPRRLAMFDSKSQAGNNENNDGNNASSTVDNIDSVMDSLASQLADFHTFGASFLTDSQSGALPPATASASS